MNLGTRSAPFVRRVLALAAERDQIIAAMEAVSRYIDQEAQHAA